MRRSALLVVAALAGCGEASVEDKRVLVVDEDSPDVDVIGVLPEQFECSSVAPDAELQSIIGAFQRVDSAFPVQDGLAAPCNYLARAGDSSASWSFDLDCRDRALQDGKALMVQYATDLDAKAVRVGTSGIDYRNTALLFIDDDTPCYVRVLGPAAEGRLALAQIVAERLDETTAPTSLRYRRGAETP